MAAAAGVTISFPFSLGIGVLAIAAGVIASNWANNNIYDKLWEWWENGGLLDLWNEIFRKNVNSSYAEKVRGSVREGTRRIDPLVIDLDGDGIELRDIKESRAFFDLSGSGFANRVGWVSPDDALLVLDRNNNGRVDDISELFGSDRQSGFAELGLYDSNRDGRIDAFDEVFKNLKVWQDHDGDGRVLALIGWG